VTSLLDWRNLLSLSCYALVGGATYYALRQRVQGLIWPIAIMLVRSAAPALRPFRTASPRCPPCDPWALVPFA
jgi:hypothetical protein